MIVFVCPWAWKIHRAWKIHNFTMVNYYLSINFPLCEVALISSGGGEDVGEGSALSRAQSRGLLQAGCS